MLRRRAAFTRPAERRLVPSLGYSPARRIPAGHEPDRRYRTALWGRC